MVSYTSINRNTSVDAIYSNEVREIDTSQNNAAYCIETANIMSLLNNV